MNRIMESLESCNSQSAQVPDASQHMCDAGVSSRPLAALRVYHGTGVASAPKLAGKGPFMAP